VPAFGRRIERFPPSLGAAEEIPAGKWALLDDETFHQVVVWESREDNGRLVPESEQIIERGAPFRRLRRSEKEGNADRALGPLEGLKNSLFNDRFPYAGIHLTRVALTRTFPPAESPRKLRPNQKHREQVRDVARRIWREDPTVTIADMIRRDEIREMFAPGMAAPEVPQSKEYKQKTLRNWVKDLAPTHKPGRRAKLSPTSRK
jgi:hypothetical protein